MTDERLEELYGKFLKFADDMAGEYGPMEVAAIMMAQSLTIYKSAMSNEDYNHMVDNISDSRNQVKTFERQSIQ
jgi:hypothetical protein